MNRWLYFLSELVIAPGQKVPAGALHEATEEQKAELRALRGGERAFLDVTPRPIALAVAWIFGRPGFHATPESSAILMPCPECTRPTGAPGNFRMLERMTRCPVCGDKRTVVAPCPWSMTDWSRGARNFARPPRSAAP